MSRYVFDQAWEQERERLAGLEGRLDPGTIRHMGEIGVGAGWRCLEVAGGAGSITRWLSQRVGPAGSVVATDLDTRFLDALELSNVEVRRHDIVNDAIADDEFDLAHARCLLMHLPAREEALKRMYAAVKPGGWLLVEDMEAISWITVTPSEAHDRVRDAMLALLQAAGADPFLGRNLTKMMTELGLEEVEAEGRVTLGTREANPGLLQYKLTLRQLAEPMVAGGVATREDVDEALRLIDDPEWYGMPPVIMAAWGRKARS